jgi:hypothetical protein
VQSSGERGHPFGGDRPFVRTAEHTGEIGPHGQAGSRALDDRTMRRSDCSIPQWMFFRLKGFEAAPTEGRLDFGLWEQIFYREFDGPAAQPVLLKQRRPDSELVRVRREGPEGQAHGAQ